MEQIDQPESAALDGFSLALNERPERGSNRHWIPASSAG
jgi:hypothetical protein